MNGVNTFADNECAEREEYSPEKKEFSLVRITTTIFTGILTLYVGSQILNSVSGELKRAEMNATTSIITTQTISMVIPIGIIIIVTAILAASIHLFD